MPGKNSRDLLKATWNFLRYFEIWIHDIPRFLAKVLTMFLGTLVGKRSSRWLPMLWSWTFCLHLYGIRIDKTEGGVTKSLWNVGITELNYTVSHSYYCFSICGPWVESFLLSRTKFFLYVFLILVLLEFLLETFSFCKKFCVYLI